MGKSLKSNSGPLAPLTRLMTFFRYLSSVHLWKILLDTCRKWLNRELRNALDLISEGGEKIMETLADQWIREGEGRGFIIGEQKSLVKGELKNAR